MQFLSADARVLFTFLTLNPDSKLTPEPLAHLLFSTEKTEKDALNRLCAAQENLWEAFPISVRLFRGLTIQDATNLQVPVRLAPQMPVISLSADAFELTRVLESDWEDLSRPETAALLTEAAVAIGKGMAPGISGAWIDEWRERLCCLYRDATIRFMAADPALCLKVRAERPFLGGSLKSAPASRSPFYGRTKELARLQELLGSGERVISLVGLGGAGKTRLALELLSTLPGELVYWPQANVSLSGVSTRGGLLEALRKGLGQQMGDVLQDGRDPLGAICRALQEPTVLFIDNAEDAVRNSSDGEVAQTLGYLVYRCPQAILISTSRCRIGLPEEYVFPVEGLPLPTEDEQSELTLVQLQEHYPGLEMLSKSVQASGGDLSPDRTAAIVALLRHSGGLPLSIELLATRISKQGAELPTVDDIKLSAGSPRSAIDWALEPLSIATRAFLQRLSIFEGAFGIEDAQAVTGELEVEFRLTELDDAGLITLIRSNELDSSTYRLSPAVRDFVREDLESSSEISALEERHRLYFARLAADGNIGLRGVDRVLWLPRLRQAASDILSIIRRNLSIDLNIEFATQVFSDFVHYFISEAKPHEGISLAKQVISRAHEVGGISQLLEVESLDALGRLETVAGFHQQAEINLKAAFRFWQSGKYLRETARCANNIAVCCNELQRFDEAKYYFDIAWRGFYEINERRTCAQILQNMAFRLKANRLWLDAHDLLEEACEIVTREFPSESLTAKFLFDYAEVLYIQENDDKAISIIKQTLQIMEMGQDTLRLSNLIALAGLVVKRSSKYVSANSDLFILSGWAVSRNITDKPIFVAEVVSEIGAHIQEMRLKEIPVFSENDLELIRKQILTL